MATNENINSGGRKNGKSSQFVDCLHDGDTNYSVTTGIDVSAVDFTSSNGYMVVGLILTEGTGNIAFEMEMGGKMTIPFNVTADQGSMRAMDGYRIKTIYTSGTTFTGNIFPVF